MKTKAPQIDAMNTRAVADDLFPVASVGFLALSLLIALPSAARADALNQWTPVTTNIAGAGANDIAYGNGLFVLTGGRGMIWTGGKTGPLIERRPALFEGFSLSGVAFGDGRFAVVGTSNFVAASTNCLDWERILYQRGDEDDPQFVRFEGVCLAQGKIVAVTTDGFGVTYDGTNWHRHSVSRYNAVAYGDKFGIRRFVAVSPENRIAWSSDGLTWTSTSLASGNTFMGVAYGNGLFVAATLQGRAFVSATGDSWGNGTPLPPGHGAEHVAFGGGVFTICSGHSVLTSFGGSPWTPRPLPEPNDLIASGYGDGVFLAASDEGVIFQSGDVRPQLTGAPLPDGSAFAITLRGGMAAGFWLQSSPSPSGPWRDLNWFLHDGAETPYVDPVPGWREDAARFYRLR